MDRVIGESFGDGRNRQAGAVGSPAGAEDPEGRARSRALAVDATLVIRGKTDRISPAPGALAYKCDLTQFEVHLLDIGHFALEEDGPLIADHVRRFLAIHV